MPDGKIRNRHRHKKPKFHENQLLRHSVLEDNKKALNVSQKFKICSQHQMTQKLDPWIRNDADLLMRYSKIGDRVLTLKEIAPKIMQISPNEWNDIYNAIIRLAQETMGWEGSDARNPILAKTFLMLISEAMANANIDRKNHGLFSIYLSWAMQRLGESKFNKLATECLLNTCYQFTPKVVFSQIEKLLLEPTAANNHPFKNGMFYMYMYIF